MHTPAYERHRKKTQKRATQTAGSPQATKRYPQRHYATAPAGERGYVLNVD